MRSRAQIIGKAAEEQVKTWAAQAEIVASRPDEDRQGWDLFLELPVDEVGIGPKCLVQVKATDAASRKCPVRVETWKRLIQNPWPAFFFILEYERRNEPQRLYIVHVWDRWIEAVLAHLRAQSVASQVRRSPQTLRLAWQDSDEVSPRTGKAIHESILGHVGSDPYEYVIEKRRILNSVGYGSHPHRATISFAKFDHRDIAEVLADHAIGLIPEIDAHSVQTFEERFGISLPSAPAPRALPMKISVQPQPANAQLRFAPMSGRAPVQVPCKVYLSTAAFPFLPKSHQKARIVADDVEIILEFESRRMRINAHLPDPAEPVTIGRANRAATILRMLQKHRDDPLHIDLVADNSTIPFSPGNAGVPEFDGNMMQCTETIAATRHIVHALGLDDEESVRLAELYAQCDTIAALAQYLSQPQRDVRYWGSMTCGAEIESGPMAAVFAAGAAIGRHLCAIVAVVIGHGEVSPISGADQRWTFDIRNGSLSVRERIVETPSADLKAILNELITKMGRELDQPPISHVVLMLVQ